MRGDPLSAAIAAIRGGRKREAEQLLRQVIARESDNEWAWFWLSAAVEGIEAQRECLHRVLQINPNNAYARSGLAFLSHLRAGQEWKAADAPWAVGVEEEVARASSQRCPRCGTVNPAWAYTCSRCGAVLQAIDIAEIAKREELTRIRSSGGFSVVDAWPGAIALNGKVAFEPEVELASLRRSLTALLLGGLLLVLVRCLIPLVWGAVERRTPLVDLARTLPAFLLPEGLTLAGGLLVAYLVALLLFPLARLLGGRGSLGVHVHLVAVAFSAWAFIASLMVLLLWLALMLLAGTEWGGTVLAVLLVASLALVPFYLLVLLIQALRAAHQFSGVRATLGVVGGVAVGVLAVLALGVSPTRLLLGLVRFVLAVLFPAFTLHSFL